MRAFLLILAFFIIPPLSGAAYVFVYEVETKDTTFQTVSKLHPDSFLMYNGGEDIILRLTILKIYADKEFNQALEDYGLQSNNMRYMPHKADAGGDNRSRVPFYWWR